MKWNYFFRDGIEKEKSIKKVNKKIAIKRIIRDGMEKKNKSIKKMNQNKTNSY
jgi:D-Tyr-tRNAtyr deacylase